MRRVAKPLKKMVAFICDVGWLGIQFNKLLKNVAGQINTDMSAKILRPMYWDLERNINAIMDGNYYFTVRGQRSTS